MLVHGSAGGTLIRIIGSLHAANFPALLIVDVVIPKGVLPGGLVRDAK
jgi:hypothetical protein